MEFMSLPKYLFIINCMFFLVLALSCSESSKEKSSIHERLNQEGTSLVRRITNDTGAIREVVKYYTLDTFPRGAEIHYSTRGKIRKWLWFKKGVKYAVYGIYFDENGKFKSQRGVPFLNAVNLGKNTLAIETVNPPNTNFLVGYRDFENGKIMHKLLKEPGKSDSTSWMTVPGHQFKKGHNYMVYFYIADSAGKRIDSLYQELAP